jgi:hypothetical protein
LAKDLPPNPGYLLLAALFSEHSSSHLTWLTEYGMLQERHADAQQRPEVIMFVSQPASLPFHREKRSAPKTEDNGF